MQRFSLNFLLLNFQSHNLFNDFDNNILINLFVFKKEINEFAALINESPELIMNRYHLILRQIRLIYIEKVKNKICS